MGMSASQARLLSITSRLSDNELRSQTITTAKMSLANKTTIASAAYMNALSQTQLNYSTYDGSGNKMTQILTAHTLTHYGELKNQYGVVNNAGQILVSERDAMNYESSADMYEFLDKYGVLAPEGSGEMVQVVNPEWQVAWDEYDEAYAEWQTQEPDKDDEKYWYTETVTNSSSELYESFIGAGGCLGGAIGGSSCYMHVLADAIGPGTHTTSSGETYTVYEGSCGEHSKAWCWNTARHSRATFDPITEKMKESHCSGDVIPGGTEQATINGSTVTVGGPPSDPNMTVYQRAVDLLWEVHDEYTIGSSTGGSGTAESLQKFFYFVEHDLKQMDTEEVRKFNEEVYNQDRDAWLEQEPEKPNVDYYTEKEIRSIERKDEGQWYVNLWHRMNGASDVKAGTVDENGQVIGGGKTEDGLPSYKVLEDGLMNSPEWIQTALNNGLVSLERVEFVEQTEVGTGLSDCKWNSIIWTNAIDITEDQNEVAITKAEIEYKQALNDIEAKDKQYDNQLKRLDTEHNALQTEYDSIKQLIGKNVERTLKMYS